MKNLEDDMLESKSESQNVEFKKNWRDEYLQWVCGFANAFYRAGFIESWGRGIQKIKAGFENAGLVAPSIQATMGGMMVSILRRENPYVNPYVNPHENASGLDARIISEIQSNARITIQALAEICGKNRDTIRVHLRNMQQKGLVKRVGPDKGGHWEVVKK